MATKNKKHSPKKTASKNTKTSSSRKPNPTIQTGKKNNPSGKGVHSQSDAQRKAGMDGAAKKLKRANAEKQTPFKKSK
jgi:hypothetical protein